MLMFVTLNVYVQKVAIINLRIGELILDIYILLLSPQVHNYCPRTTYNDTLTQLHAVLRIRRVRNPVSFCAHWLDSSVATASQFFCLFVFCTFPFSPSFVDMAQWALQQV